MKIAVSDFLVDSFTIMVSPRIKEENEILFRNNLIKAILHDDNQRIDELLADKGRPSLDFYFANLTPLIIACGNRNLAGVQALVENGARVDFTDQWGRTPLSMAREKKYLEIAKYLEQHTHMQNLELGEQQLD